MVDGASGMNEDPRMPSRWRDLGSLADATDQAAAQRGNRRRLLVFGLTFLAALLIGQAWNFSRPAEFRASTRLQVNLPEVGRSGPSASGAYATKLQLFDSRPMLAKLSEALVASGLPADTLGADPAGRLQAMLQVLPIQGSEIVELRATGTDPRLLADVLNAFPEVIRQEIASRQQKDADTQLAAARQELARLERAATERRARLDTFRQREGVLAERGDNEAVARAQGLNRALDTAVEKEAAAAARLAAVSKAAEQGKSSTQARADPALSGLETRAHQLREDLKELERSYTPDFLAMDPRARAMRARLAELENQIVQQRGISLQAALQAAQEEHAGAQAQVERLRAQSSAARPALTKTTSRFAEAKVLEDDLAQVDKARRDLLERVSRLEADEQRRVATVSVVEAATVPALPFRPDHWRDSAWVLAAAAALALMVMGTVELFNRSAPAAPTPANTTVLLAPGWAERQAQLGAPGLQAPPQLSALPATAALPAPMPLLSQAEATALLMACSGPARLLCALGLMGLSVDEALQVRPRDLDRASQQLQVSGAWARRLPVPHWLTDSLPEEIDAGRVVLHDAAGQALTPADVASMIISAGLDAQLEGAATLDWDVLRNTAIDWLVGQGLRYTELPKLVGRVDADRLQQLSSRHGDTRRRNLDEVERLMPALQLDPGA
jgi:succinoglycan biosynthesis transport protein ExoP